MALILHVLKSGCRENIGQHSDVWTLGQVWVLVMNRSNGQIAKGGKMNDLLANAPDFTGPSI